MPIKILHILHDEKFIDGAIDIFDSTSAINTYVSIEDEKPFVCIKLHSDDVQIVERDKILSFIIEGGYQLVAFHTLTRDKYELVLQIPRHVKVLWLAWGYDIYFPWNNMPAVLPIKIYKPLTLNSVLPTEYVPFVKKIKRLIKKVIFYNRYRKQRLEHQCTLNKELNLQQQLIHRIDFMSTVLPSEYDLLSALKGFNAKYFPFQYALRNDFSVESIENNASKILLGNSSTATNNHLDIINVLKANNISNECIIPSSYGDTDYLVLLKQAVSDVPNLSFLDTFMPIEEYTNLLKLCRIGIFGHIRQQAIGNILMCMLQGSKVFLWRDSVAYKFFKKAGYIVYTIDKDLTEENVNKLMSEEEREINRRLAVEQFTFIPVVNRLERFLIELQGE